MASGDALPIPRKNTAYRVTFPIMDADGDLVTGATGLDSEVSKDGGTFADCTNEATEIATSSGIYYLDLTSTEMNADTVAIIVKTGSSGAKTTVLVLYPEEAGDIRVNTVQVGGTTQTAKDIGAAVPAAAAGASGGLLISGSNSGTTTLGALTVTGATALAALSTTTITASGAVAFQSTFGVTGATTLAALTCTTLTATTNAVPWNASWDAEMQSEVNDGLVAFFTSAAAFVDLVWDEPTSGHATAGTTGLALSSASAPSAAAVADAVWDELLSGHAIVGSTGAGLSAAGSAGDPWSTVLPGVYADGTAGYAVGTYVDATISSRVAADAPEADQIYTASSSSIVRICNIALTMIGEATITSLAESSKAARVCDLRFGDVRDSVLRDHPWNSASKRVSLAKLESTPAFGYTMQFQIPTDYLRLVRVDENREDFVFEGDKILANAEPFKMVYVASTSSPAGFDELLRQAIAARLAHELCLALTRNQERANMMWKLYEAKLAAARHADAAEGRSDRLVTESWLNSRLGTDDGYRRISSE